MLEFRSNWRTSTGKQSPVIGGLEFECPKGMDMDWHFCYKNNSCFRNEYEGWKLI